MCVCECAKLRENIQQKESLTNEKETEMRERVNSFSSVNFYLFRIQSSLFWFSFPFSLNIKLFNRFLTSLFSRSSVLRLRLPISIW